MKSKKTRTHLLILLVGLSSGGIAAQIPTEDTRKLNTSSKANREVDFKVFWPKFRDAALMGDSVKIEALTRFPFKEIVLSLQNETRMHDKSDFGQLWSTLLTQDSGAGGGMSMRDYITTREFSVAGDVTESGNRARIGTFEFEKLDQGWTFTACYAPLK